MDELLEILRKASDIEPHKFACITISIYPKLVKDGETAEVSLATYSYFSNCAILGQKTVTSAELSNSLRVVLEELQNHTSSEGEVDSIVQGPR